MTRDGEIGGVLAAPLFAEGDSPARQVVTADGAALVAAAALPLAFDATVAGAGRLLGSTILIWLGELSASHAGVRFTGCEAVALPGCGGVVFVGAAVEAPR